MYPTVLEIFVRVKQQRGVNEHKIENLQLLFEIFQIPVPMPVLAASEDFILEIDW